MALEHQLNIVSLVSAVNKAELRLWTVICITRRQDEKKIPSKLFFFLRQFPSEIHSYKLLNQMTCVFYESHESKSSLESAVHESNSSPKSLFMRLKCDSSPSLWLEFPSLGRTFWVAALIDNEHDCRNEACNCTIVLRWSWRPTVSPESSVKILNVIVSSKVSGLRSAKLTGGAVTLNNRLAATFTICVNQP